MIVTVTANTTVDQVMFISKFEPGKTIRAKKTVHAPGGKPTDASYILAGHGIKNLALGLAAGSIGGKIRQILTDQGVDVDFVECKGETRMAIAIATDDGLQTTITPNTLIVEPEHLALLRQKFEAVLPKASAVILGGSLPPGMDSGFYTDFVSLAKSYNVPVIVDLKPDNMRAALEAGADYLKPNHEEMAGLVGYPVETYDDAYRAGKEIFEQYGAISVISMGSLGAFAYMPDKAYKIPPIKIDIVSAVGAGDAVLAGIAYAVSLGKPLEDGLRFGVGTATAVCLHPGTSMFELELAQKFIEQVELIPYP